MDQATSFERPLVILNPSANRGKMQRYRALLHQRVQQESADYVETQQQGNAYQHALAAASARRGVIVVGGDGTINEVVNGLLSSGKRVPLGIVGAGSGNDFAWNTLKLPQKPEEAIERAFSGRLVSVDAGKINNTYFANAFGVGLDADIAAAVGQMKKFPFLSGARLYYAAILRQLLFGYHRCPWLTFGLDSPTEPSVGAQRYILIAVSNGPAYGAGFYINPEAKYDDGLFDVCTIAYTPLPRALKLLPIAKKGQHADLPEVAFFRTRKISITSTRPQNVQIDGETQQATRFEAEVLPGALLVRI